MRIIRILDEDGYLYQQSMKHLCVNDNNDFVIGIEIYADSTWCDVLGQYNCEPVIATLSCFKRAIRQSHNAQIILGFISDMDHKSSAEGDQAAKNASFTGTRYRNYHRQLDILLAGLQKLQRGFMTCLNLCHKSEIRNVILPIISVLGDGKSQDMMVGRYGTQHLSTGRQMWMCDCSVQNADNHLKKCDLIDDNSVKKINGVALGFYSPKGSQSTKLLSKKVACKGMKQLSQYVGDNAFQHVLKATDCLEDQGTESIGIFRMTPMCGMHFISPGIGKNLIETMLGAMSVQSGADLDRLVIRMFTTRRQSKKNQFPTTNLCKGISNLCKKTSDKWTGVIFYLGIVFRTGIGCHLLTDSIQRKYLDDSNKMEDKSIIDLFKDRKAIENFGYMLECLSTYDAFNKKKGDIGMQMNIHPKQKVKSVY